MNKIFSKRKTIIFIGMFIFVIFLLQPVSTIHQAESSSVLNWENPNKKGFSPYKFKVSDVLNSQLLTQVVGCTGVVEKLSYYMNRFGQIIFNTRSKAALDATKAKIAEEICLKIRAAAQTGAGTQPATGILDVTEALKDFLRCDVVETVGLSNEDKAREYDRAQEELAQRRAESCFNGIAFTLAKNQLTSMTRYAVSWVNSGFGGDPFFVQNVTSFTSNIERELLQRGMDVLLPTSGHAYPYGTAFSRSLINGYSATRGGALSALDSLKSDLSYFITDPNSYLSDSALSKLEISKRANKAFEKDFSTGGWDGWLALTQRDQNNPLGFYIVASNLFEEERAQKEKELNNELLQNNGFLSQKRCKTYRPVVKITGPTIGQAGQAQTAGSTTTAAEKECIEWEVVTPGSLIKDKISMYMNSPERQLEIADDINSALNSLFSALISKFQDQGLTSLNPDRYIYTSEDMGGGYGLRSLDSSFGESRGFSDGSFDLTRDLGNRFIYGYTADSYLGRWDAETNTPKLTKGIGPVVIGQDDKATYPINVYYEVSKAGRVNLFDNGYSGWAVGDRVFWDGSNWQNWKCGQLGAKDCPLQKNPILKRGIIQIQKDYVVAAKEMLQNLPSIMPKIGELDYCIPGPNLNWKRTYGEAVEGFTNYAFSLSSEYRQGNWFRRDSQDFKVAGPGDEEYDNYKNIFKDSPLQWSRIIKSPTWLSIEELAVGVLKKDKAENVMTDLINARLNTISSNLRTFEDAYEKIINGLYGAGGIMQTPFLQKEDSEELIKNTSYLPVAEVASTITKNILTYDEDIKEMTEHYKSEIIQANTNIYKLDQIKNEVSIIIKAAQARRDARLLEVLNNEAKRTGGAVLTEPDYKKKYATCLEEENIIFYDDLDIMKDTTSQKERCFDGLDNDLDGLVDEKDPDCAGVSLTRSGENTNAPLGGTTIGNMGQIFDRPNNERDTTYNYQTIDDLER